MCYTKKVVNLKYTNVYFKLKSLTKALNQMHLKSWDKDGDLKSSRKQSCLQNLGCLIKEYMIQTDLK